MAKVDEEEYDDEEYVDEEGYDDEEYDNEEEYVGEEYDNGEEYYEEEENNDKDEMKYGTITFIAMLAFSVLIFLFIAYPDFLIKPQGGVVAGYTFTMPGIVWLIFPVVAVLYFGYKLEKK